MKFKSRNRSNILRNLLICVGLLPVFVFVTGCCMCKVKDSGKVLLIVKQADELNPDKYTPEGAVIDFTKLKPGDTLRVINQYGKDVEADFPAGIIEGERIFNLKNCKGRTITIKSDITVVTPFFVKFSGGGDHGGADMIIDPGQN